MALEKYMWKIVKSYTRTMFLLMTMYELEKRYVAVEQLSTLCLQCNWHTPSR